MPILKTLIDISHLDYPPNLFIKITQYIKFIIIIYLKTEDYIGSIFNNKKYVI